MIPNTGKGQCRFCGSWIPNPNPEIGVSEECSHCGKADPIEPLWRVRQRNLEEWKPKGSLEKFFKTLDEWGGLSIVLPLAIVIGFGVVKLIQYLSGNGD